MIEIKPCPFCGGEAYATKGQVFFSPVYYVTCSECGANNYLAASAGVFIPYDKSQVIFTSDKLAIEKAIEKWNKRPVNNEVVNNR